MQSAAHEPLYDIDPRTSATIEVFYADRTPETSPADWRWLVLVVAPAVIFTRWLA